MKFFRTCTGYVSIVSRSDRFGLIQVGCFTGEHTVMNIQDQQVRQVGDFLKRFCIEQKGKYRFAVAFGKFSSLRPYKASMVEIPSMP